MEFMFDIGWSTIPIIIGIFVAGLILGIGYLIGRYWRKKKE